MFPLIVFSEADFIDIIMGLGILLIAMVEDLEDVFEGGHLREAVDYAMQSRRM
jgi:hypothetical protein